MSSGSGQKESRVKSIIQTVLGLGIIGFFVWGLVARFYRDMTDDFIEVTKPAAAVSAPIRNAQFWVEQELEKTSGNSALAAQESNEVLLPLFERLKVCGALLPEKLETLSERAVAELTRLDAWRGGERDAWQVAAASGAAFMFKAELVGADFQRSNLRGAKFVYSVYDMKDRSLLWQLEAKRESGFFTGRVPDADEQTENIVNALKAAKLLSADACTAQVVK